MSMEVSISLEETNKNRIKLGLKPLTDDKEPALDADKVAENNYAKRREKETKEKETKKIQDRIAKVRNRRELNASLKGATLGDAADDDVDDTLKWIKRNKKKERQLAEKRQKELESRDKEVFDEYTERELEGLKVSHDFDKMDEGESRILTLKDSRILDNEEDELHNVEMAEEENLQKRLELKVKKHDYTGYDDEEFKDGNQGLIKRSILSKYDEDIEGSQQSTFRLGSSTISTKVQREQGQQQNAAALNKASLSIDYSKRFELNDYVEEGEVGFKKPKTKKKRSSRRALDSEIHDEDQKMDLDHPVAPRIRNLDANFVDDDELQAALARSRKAKLHRSKKISPEELAKKIVSERAKEEVAIMQEPEAEGGEALTFDETSEFVQAVGSGPAVKANREHKAPSSTPAPKPESRDVSMAPGDVALDELEAGEVRVKDDDDEDIDMEMLGALEDVIKQTEEAARTVAENNEVAVGTSSEQHFASGMAATLNVLRQQGILAQPNSDVQEREQVQTQRDLWLAELRRRQAQRELGKLQARGGNKDQAQREYENRFREQQEAREQMEMFKNYKPDVDLSYHDEHGRKLSTKEAWKALSHKFHGKGSGKMKTEKLLKKIAEEKKKEAMASGDTPLSMNRAFQIRQEKTGQAHFILSVGNRGAVPQAADFSDPQPLAKGKTERTKKKKETKIAQTGDAGFITLPAPSLHLTSNGASSNPSASSSPAPKAGFSRIASAVVVEASSHGNTPTPAERPKVTFGGLGVKRKAGEDAVGTPPPKRR